ncbi:hypothetical protein AYO44_14290, partial [Planctomycetaceae bacterium SCGC AG-212-F19]
MRTGQLHGQVRAALLDAFRRPGEMAIVVANAELGKSFANFLAVPGTTYEEAVFNLLDWVEAQDQLTRLLRAASRENSGNLKLRAVVGHLAPLESKYAALRPDLSFGEAERIVLRGITFEDAGIWLDRLGRMRRAVCRVELQPPLESVAGYGTGYLVAPDVVMTAFHVAAPFWKDTARARGVRFRFDFETGITGVGSSGGTEHKLAMAITSPAAEPDRKHPWQCLASPEPDLDFALIRLDRFAAEDVVDAAPREFLKLTSRPFQVNDPMLILQHPAAAPLKLSFGVVQGPVTPNRVLYKVNTEPGSSG